MNVADDILEVQSFLNSFSFEKEMEHDQLLAEIKSYKMIFDKATFINASFQDLRTERDIPLIKLFLSDFNILEERVVEIEKSEAPRFNLFNILQIERYETKVHTPFLFNLLSPNGSHAQGRLFVDAFLHNLLGDNYDKSKTKSITVKSEFRRDGHNVVNGQIDISITYFEKGKMKSVVIENKIDHHDEYLQLARYHDFLTKTLLLNIGDYHLLYLTPDGRKPTETSIPHELYTELKNSGAITEWSYQVNLYNVLLDVMNEVKAETVRSTLNQYLKTIKYL